MKSLQDLNVSEKLFCITGDNAANNSTMAEAIAKQLPQFNSDHNLLGCIGHVLNIAAKRGMDAVGLDWGEYLVRVLDEDRLEIEQEKMMEDSETDDSELEDFHDYSGNESVLKRIRKIVSHIRNSPQKRVAFEQTAIRCIWSGQVYHKVGSLMSLPNAEAKLLQIYFLGDEETEAKRRCSIMPGTNNSLIGSLQRMLHQHNHYVRQFQMAIDNNPTNLKIVIRADRKP